MSIKFENKVIKSFEIMNDTTLSNVKPFEKYDHKFRKNKK